MSSAHPAFVSPAELAAVVERLEARALRAERAILERDERLERLEADARVECDRADRLADRINALERRRA